MNKLINNNILSRAFLYLSCFILAASLTSCGGGGGGGTSPTVSIADVSVVEGNSGTTDLVFTLSLSAAAGTNATVNYATSDGTAVAGQDYTAASGSLSVPSGATSATITVSVNTDTNYEADETFTLTLSSPSGLTLGTVSSATGTITNDDDANPKGYFSGTAAVSSNLSDVTGLAYDNRLMMFSPAANVLYDITITNITGTDFTGTAEVYVNGAISQPGVAVTGTTNDAQISGTMSGTASSIADGTFDILYDISSNAGATLARIEAPSPNSWHGSIYGQDNDADSSFAVDNTGAYTGVDFTEITNSCAYLGSLTIPSSEVNIYGLSHDVVAPGASITCNYESTLHTGFASVINGTGVDNKLVYGFANGAVSVFAIMTLP